MAEQKLGDINGRTKKLVESGMCRFVISSQSEFSQEILVVGEFWEYVEILFDQLLINMKQINQVDALSPLYTDGPHFYVTPGNPKPHHSFTCLSIQLCLWL